MESTKNKSLTAEQRAVLCRVEGLIEYWGISPSEIKLRPVAKKARPKAAEVKYRHPVTGETWDGQGAHPEWLRRALLQEGYLVSELVATAERATA